jgi:hypothetical protein
VAVDFGEVAAAGVVEYNPVILAKPATERQHLTIRHPTHSRQ